MEAGVLRSPKRTAFFAELVAGHAAYEPSMVGVILDGEGNFRQNIFQRLLSQRNHRKIFLAE